MMQQINWKKGMFRIWIVLSVLYLPIPTFIGYKLITATSMNLKENSKNEFESLVTVASNDKEEALYYKRFTINSSCLDIIHSLRETHQNTRFKSKKLDVYSLKKSEGTNDLIDDVFAEFDQNKVDFYFTQGEINESYIYWDQLVNNEYINHKSGFKKCISEINEPTWKKIREFSVRTVLLMMLPLMVLFLSLLLFKITRWVFRGFEDND